MEEIILKLKDAEEKITRDLRGYKSIAKDDLLPADQEYLQTKVNQELKKRTHNYPTLFEVPQYPKSSISWPKNPSTQSSNVSSDWQHPSLPCLLLPQNITFVTPEEEREKQNEARMLSDDFVLGKEKGGNKEEISVKFSALKHFQKEAKIYSSPLKPAVRQRGDNKPQVPKKPFVVPLPQQEEKEEKIHVQAVKTLQNSYYGQNLNDLTKQIDQLVALKKKEGEERQQQLKAQLQKEYEQLAKEGNCRVIGFPK